MPPCKLQSMPLCKPPIFQPQGISLCAHHKADTHAALQPLFSNHQDEALHRNGIFRCRLKSLGAVPVFVDQRVVGTVVIVQSRLACNHARKPPLFATEASVTLLRMFMCS